MVYRLRVIQATAIELCNCHQNKLKAIAQLTFTICCSCVGSTKSSRTSRVTCFLFVAFDMTQRVPFEQHALSCSPAILSHLRNNFRSSLCQERLERLIKSKGFADRLVTSVLVSDVSCELLRVHMHVHIDLKKTRLESRSVIHGVGWIHFLNGRPTVG